MKGFHYNDVYYWKAEEGDSELAVVGFSPLECSVLVCSPLSPRSISRILRVELRTVSLTARKQVAHLHGEPIYVES